MMKRAADYCTKFDSEKVDVGGSMQYAIGAYCVADLGDAPFSIWRSSRPRFGSGCFPRVTLRFTARLSKSAVSPLNATCNV
jgi:hypothetical protein